MKVTIVNQFYSPDLSPTAHLAASLAEHRAENGDDVTVIASHGGYVPSSHAAKYESGVNPRVLRTWTPRFGKANIVKRCLDYACFYIGAAWRMLTLPRQDVIVAMTTPPFIAWAAALHKMLHPSAQLILWNMDCYPEVVERAGIIRKGKLLSRLMRAANRALFRRLDHLICLDYAMLELLRRHYDPQARVAASVVPNWERADFYKPESCSTGNGQNSMKPHDKMVILYTGNMGCGHSFDTVLSAAERLRNDPVEFLFVGGGSKAKQLEGEARRRGLTNIVMKGYVQREEIRRIMAEADCALITLRDDMLGVMSPSKLHSNLAMGLPVLYVGPRESNVDDAVKRFNCGVSLRHGESCMLCSVIRTLRAKPHMLAELRAAARRAFETTYCDIRTLPLFDTILNCPQTKLVYQFGEQVPSILPLEPRRLQKAA